MNQLLIAAFASILLLFAACSKSNDRDSADAFVGRYSVTEQTTNYTDTTFFERTTFIGKLIKAGGTELKAVQTYRDNFPAWTEPFIGTNIQTDSLWLRLSSDAKTMTSAMPGAAVKMQVRHIDTLLLSYTYPAGPDSFLVQQTWVRRP